MTELLRETSLQSTSSETLDPKKALRDALQVADSFKAEMRAIDQNR